jgi:hypothetical protein
MQQTAQRSASGPARRCGLASGRCGPRPFSSGAPHARVAVGAVAAATNGASNGTGKAGAGVPRHPAPAQTIRTVVDIVNEGTLCSVSSEGHPMGIPVAFSMTKQGALQLHLDGAALSLANIAPGSACSLVVQPISHPARAVAAVTLIGKVQPEGAEPMVPFHVQRCLYFGGLDKVSRPGGLQFLTRLSLQPPSHTVTSQCFTCV